MLLSVEGTFQTERGASAKTWKMGLVCVRTSVCVTSRKRGAGDGPTEVMGPHIQGPHSEMSSVGAF